MPKYTLRKWQIEAQQNWIANNYKGIISVVTGGGKTIFALSCIEIVKPQTTLIVVPTIALLEQWWEEAANYFDLDLDEINIINGNLRFKLGTINIAVLNTASKLAERIKKYRIFLIVDECHKSASEQFSTALSVNAMATLGLSATPERPYDNGLLNILIPKLGEIIYKYDYKDALVDKVIVPFELRNIIFELEKETQKQYDKITKVIAQYIQKYGIDSPETISLYLRRARILSLSTNRVLLTLRIVANNKNRRILIFHEDIKACNVIDSVLKANGVNSGTYHSRMKLKEKAFTLKKYRNGEITVLVTCRSLDEGFNVPETEIGIIAASTATRRQRIQRLGRILRPTNEKKHAIIYTLIATGPEVKRLKDEEKQLYGVAKVVWTKA